MYGPASGGGGGGRGDMGGQIIGPGGGPGGRGKPRLLTPKGQMAGMNAPPPLSSLPPRECIGFARAKGSRAFQLHRLD